MSCLDLRHVYKTRFGSKFNKSESDITIDSSTYKKNDNEIKAAAVNDKICIVTRTTSSLHIITGTDHGKSRIKLHDGTDWEDYNSGDGVSYIIIKADSSTGGASTVPVAESVPVTGGGPPVRVDASWLTGVFTKVYNYITDDASADETAKKIRKDVEDRLKKEVQEPLRKLLDDIEAEDAKNDKIADSILTKLSINRFT